jgi:hypothetical protein
MKSLSGVSRSRGLWDSREVLYVLLQAPSKISAKCANLGLLVEEHVQVIYDTKF